VKLVANSNENFNYFIRFREPIIYVENDNCPHIMLNILGTKVVGMLDTGAVFTFFFRYCYERIVEKLNLLIKTDQKIIVTTAAAENQLVVGFIDVPYQYKNKIKIIPTLVVPSSADF
jgi:hypothetical protein